jgi:hypothetical protein
MLLQNLRREKSRAGTNRTVPSIEVEPDFYRMQPMSPMMESSLQDGSNSSAAFCLAQDELKSSLGTFRNSAQGATGDGNPIWSAALASSGTTHLSAFGREPDIRSSINWDRVYHDDLNLEPTPLPPVSGHGDPDNVSVANHPDFLQVGAEAFEYKGQSL